MSRIKTALKEVPQSTQPTRDVDWVWVECSGWKQLLAINCRTVVFLDALRNAICERLPPHMLERQTKLEEEIVRLKEIKTLNDAAAAAENIEKKDLVPPPSNPRKDSVRKPGTAQQPAVAKVDETTEKLTRMTNALEQLKADSRALNDHISSLLKTKEFYPNVSRTRMTNIFTQTEHSNGSSTTGETEHPVLTSVDLCSLNSLLPFNLSSVDNKDENVKKIITDIGGGGGQRFRILLLQSKLSPNGEKSPEERILLDFPSLAVEI